MSFKHLLRYAAELAARHNVRDLNTIDRMVALVKGMDGKRLRYDQSTAGPQVYGPELISARSTLNVATGMSTA